VAKKLAVIYALAIVAPSVSAQGSCAYVGEAGIHNTCDHEIRVFIERRFWVSQRQGSNFIDIETSEVTNQTIAAHKVWRPQGSGYTLIKEEAVSVSPRAASGGESGGQEKIQPDNIKITPAPKDKR
jgi:hypothetical protein